MILSMLLDVREQLCRLSQLEVGDVEPEWAEQCMAVEGGGLSFPF